MDGVERRVCVFQSSSLGCFFCSTGVRVQAPISKYPWSSFFSHVARNRNIPFLKKLWPRQLIVAVRGLFSTCGKWGLLSRCGCMGFLLRWLLLLRSTGLVAPYHVESSQTGDRTHVPSFGKHILNHWTIREILYSFKCVYYCMHWLFDCHYACMFIVNWAFI